MKALKWNNSDSLKSGFFWVYKNMVNHIEDSLQLTANYLDINLDELHKLPLNTLKEQSLQIERVINYINASKDITPSNTIKKGEWTYHIWKGEDMTVGEYIDFEVFSKMPTDEFVLNAISLMGYLEKDGTHYKEKSFNNIKLRKEFLNSLTVEEAMPIVNFFINVPMISKVVLTKLEDLALSTTPLMKRVAKTPMIFIKIEVYLLKLLVILLRSVNLMKPSKATL